MSDKHVAYVVVLENEVGTEHSEKIMNAIKMISGVSIVSAQVADLQHFVSTHKAKTEMKESIVAFLTDFLNK